MTRVSLVVPSYNQAQYIGATLDSLVSQRGLSPGQLEIIVMDGGSTDGSVDIIRAYSRRLAYWASEPDPGQTFALRAGFERATGEVQGWLCSDDLLEPDTIREVVDLFDSCPSARFCYGDALWIDGAGEVIRRKKSLPFNWFIWKYDHNYILQPSAFWRRDLYQQVGGLDPRYDLAMDADLFARFAAVTQPVHVSRTWSRVRWYPQQKTRAQAARGMAEFREVCTRHGASFNGPVQTAAATALAKSLRIGWKLMKGCYLP